MSERQETWWSCMSDEAKIWLICIVGLVFLISSIAWATAWYHTSVTISAMEHGYSQKIIAGSTSPHWVKD